MKPERSAGRPERPIDTASPLAEFAAALRSLRAAAGLTVRDLASRTGYSVGGISEAASGVRLPSLELTTAFARCCGADQGEWEQRWRAAATHRKNGTTATEDSFAARADSLNSETQELPSVDDMARSSDSAAPKWIRPRARGRFSGPRYVSDWPSLSPQEKRLLMLYATGLPMKSVARRMEIRLDTAKQYLHRARTKYAEAGRPAWTKVELHRRAIEDGYLPVPVPDLRGSTVIFLGLPSGKRVRSTAGQIAWLDRTLLSEGKDFSLHQAPRCAGVRYVYGGWELFSLDPDHEVYLTPYEDGIPLAPYEDGIPPNPQALRAAARHVLSAVSAKGEPRPIVLGDEYWLVSVGDWTLELSVVWPC